MERIKSLRFRPNSLSYGNIPGQIEDRLFQKTDRPHGPDVLPSVLFLSVTLTKLLRRRNKGQFEIYCV